VGLDIRECPAVVLVGTPVGVVHRPENHLDVTGQDADFLFDDFVQRDEHVGFTRHLDGQTPRPVCGEIQAMRPRHLKAAARGGCPRLRTHSGGTHQETPVQTLTLQRPPQQHLTGRTPADVAIAHHEDALPLVAGVRHVQTSDPLVCTQDATTRAGTEPLLSTPAAAAAGGLERAWTLVPARCYVAAAWNPPREEVAVGSRSKPFAGAGTLPQYAAARTYDLRHIRLELQLDPRLRMVTGTATLRLAPLHDGLDTVTLDLASNLEVGSVRGGGRAALRFDREGDHIHVRLPRPARAGRELELQVAYAGEPRRGLYFVGPDAAYPKRRREIWSQGQDEDSKHWFPCFDHPHQKATSEVIATVPLPYRTVSNGRLVGVQKGRGKRTYHWHEEIPHPAYLVSVVVGEYEEVRGEAGGVPLYYYVHPGDAGAVQRTFGNTPAMLDFFSAAIGYPYPYEKYAQTVVGDFIFGGMENVSATTLTDAVLLDERAALDFRSDALIAHELAHQWWGNLLTCKEWSHAWLNEGFATYFEALFTEHHRGRDEFRWEMQEFAREYFQEDRDKYRRPIVERRYAKPIEIFDRHLYEKGALVLHMLRHELGDDGFWKSLRHYVRKHQFQNVETTDLKVAIEEATGRHLDAFFDQWVYGTGFPELDANWNWDAGNHQVRLRLRQTQERDAGTLPFRFPLDVEFGGPRGAVRHRIQVEHAEQTAYLPAPVRPAWVRLDPEHWILGRFRLEQGRDELLSQLGHSGDPYGIADAADALSRYVHDSAVVEKLAAAYPKAGFFGAKRAVAAALGRAGGDEARGHLVRALRERDPRARRGVVRALGEFRGDPQAAAALRTLWRTEKSYFVRGEVITALARIAGAGAWDTVQAALREESFRDTVRASALRALVEIQDERGVELARRWARPGGSRWARDAALRTLAALGRAFPTHARSAEEQMTRTLREPSFFAVISAAAALGHLGRPQAIAALRRVEESDVDGRLQRTAREAIAALTQDATPDAWKAFRSELDALRRDNRALRERLERVEAHLPVRRTPRSNQRAG